MRAGGAARIVPGARLLDVCEWVEAEIARLGAGAAFPAQTSRNEVAAHDCPSPGDERVYAVGDLAKLDIGVHVDGWVVDTATTVHVGHAGRPPAIEAAEAALQAAIAAIRPGVAVREVSRAIHDTITRFGLRTMRNLCGHGVARWTVHCPPAVPNVPMEGSTLLTPGTVIAIEPFTTDGMGMVGERGEPQVFRIEPARIPATGLSPSLARALLDFHGLPFARRQLAGFAREEVEAALARLGADGRLQSYPPLVETDGRPVAQAEHTVYVGETAVEVLTA